MWIKLIRISSLHCLRNGANIYLYFRYLHSFELYSLRPKKQIILWFKICPKNHLTLFLDQRKNCIISKLSTSSRYTQHSQSTHALSSSKSQSQTCVKNQIEGHTGIRSASRLRTSTQRTATNIPVGWNEHNLLLPSCVFLLSSSSFCHRWRRESDPNLSDPRLIDISSEDRLILTSPSPWLDLTTTNWRSGQRKLFHNGGTIPASMTP